MKLLETWAKAPFLKGRDILLVSECMDKVFPGALKKLSRGKAVLTACPEAESAGALTAKLASMVRSVRPNSLTIATMECSPHCALLHMAANEAFYILGEKIKKQHFVVIQNKTKEISADSVRLARYLHLVDRLAEKNPEIFSELKKYSLEYRCK